MTFLPADPVVSGKPYAVREVAGHDPRTLDDFVGAATIVMEDGRRVTGVGVVDGLIARFREKDSEGSKDVRVWRISRSDGTFVAEHEATY